MFDLTVREGRPVPLRDLSSGGSLLKADLTELAHKNEHLRSLLKLRQAPFSLQLDQYSTVCISGIAGSLRIFGRQVEVLPKFCNDTTWHENIAVLLSRAHGTRFDLQELTGGLRRRCGFVDHIAEAFARSLEKGLLDGPIETYREFQHEGFVVKGKIDLQATVPTALRLPGTLISRASELHGDNQFNQLLHSAASILLPLVSDPFIRSHLLTTKSQLPEIGLLVLNRQRMPDRPPLQFAAYAEALEIAAAVVQGRGWGLGLTASAAFGYVVGMERLFEKFVERTLRRVADLLPKALSARANSQVTAKFAIPEAAGLRSYYTRPDNVLYVNGSAAIIVDAKYKRFADADSGPAGRPTNSDVYQMFSSMVAQRCRVALLLYPTDQDLTVSTPIWSMQTGGDRCYVAATGLRIADLRSLSDLEAMDQQLANLCSHLLTRTIAEIRLDEPSVA